MRVVLFGGRLFQIDDRSSDRYGIVVEVAEIFPGLPQGVRKWYPHCDDLDLEQIIERHVARIGGK
jgi:hypothetical protein